MKATTITTYDFGEDCHVEGRRWTRHDMNSDPREIVGYEVTAPDGNKCRYAMSVTAAKEWAIVTLRSLGIEVAE